MAKKYCMKMNPYMLIIVLILCFCSNYCVEAQDKEGEMIYIGRKALEDGFYDVAVNVFTRFVQVFPDSEKNVTARFYIAQCYFYQGKYMDSLILLDELSRAKSAGPLGDAIIYWIAEVNFKAKDLRQAEDNYRKVIKEFPKSQYLPDAYYSLGWCLFEAAKYDEAKHVFLEMISEFPDKSLSTDASFKVAQCLYSMKDYSGLREYLPANLEKYKNDEVKSAYAYFYLGEAEYYSANYEESFKKYNLALKSAKDRYVESIAKLGLGWSAYKMKRGDEALAYVKQIASGFLNKREQASAKLLEAMLLSELNRLDEAVEAYSWIIINAEDAEAVLDAYLGKAEVFYNQSKFSAAIDLYREALEKLSGNKDLPFDRLNYGLAWAYLKEGEFKKAIAAFEKVAEKSGDSIIKAAALCQVGDTYLDSGSYEKAVEAYDEVLDKYAEGFYADYAQYQLGISLVKMSKYDSAELAFSNLMRKFPASKLIPDAVYSLGITYFQKGDYARAGSAFDKFVNQFKTHRLRAQAMYLQATSLYNMGSFQEAINIFDKIIQEYSNDLPLMQKAEYEIADCLYQMGREKEAVNKFILLKSKYPASSLVPEVVWWLGDYYYRKQEYDLSRQYLRALISGYPGSSLVADAYYAIARSYEDENNFEEAVANFKRVEKFDDRQLKDESNLAIAQICIRTGDFDEALRICEQTLAQNVNLSATIIPMIAQVYKEKGDLKEAIKFFREALNKVPLKQASGVQFNLAMCLEEAGKKDEAIEEYLKLVYLYPEDRSEAVKSYLRVAMIYEDKEEYEKAGYTYGKILEMNVPESKFAKERIDSINQSMAGKKAGK